MLDQEFNVVNWVKRFVGGARAIPSHAVRQFPRNHNDDNGDCGDIDEDEDDIYHASHTHHSKPLTRTLTHIQFEPSMEIAIRSQTIRANIHTHTDTQS